MTNEPLAGSAAVRTATNPRDPETVVTPARFALELRPEQDPASVAAAVEDALADLGAQASPLSTLEPEMLVVELPRRTFEDADPVKAFAAGYQLADEFDLVTAEPDLPTAFFPEEPPPRHAGPFVDEDVGGFPPGCWVAVEPALDSTPRWALDRMRVPEAWAFSLQQGRPSQGTDVVVAQPDTGVTTHAELIGMATVPGFDILDGDPDPTDPLRGGGNPGHGTATASVLLSPETLRVTGSTPLARHMAIRAIESVVLITQVTVARSIDWAVDHGAHVITMSLGGLPSAALHRALRRAVNADVIVLAAAGNCVRTVVWPARYDECIAVAGTNAADGQWPGTCRGAAVDISAPGQNVLRASIPRGAPPGSDSVGQGQGTSFAVALTAGVAALWLAHHGRANLVAAARVRGETLQVMFRRLLQATARRPAAWNPFEMGPGIVDARALLEADLDLGRDRESVDLPADPRERAAVTVQSLVAETVGADAADDEVLDWYRYGPELAATLLERQLVGPGLQPEAVAAPPVVTEQLAGAVSNPRLRDTLGLDDDLGPEVGDDEGGLR
jgi:serine protease